MSAEFPLSLTIKAIDKASAPIRAFTVNLHKLTAPLKNVKLFDQIKGLGEALNVGGIMKGIGGVGSAFGRVGSEAFALGAKLAGIATGAGIAFYSIVHGAMEAGDKLGEVANRVGLTVDAFASLGFAAAQADVDQEQFNGAMDKFNKNLGDMQAGKGGEFLHFLNEISPALARQMKAAKGTEAALSLMTDAFAKIDDPAKQAILASHAFGKSGLQMGQFLHQGSAAIQEQQRRYLELVGSQEEFARTSGELDNATRETELAFTGLRNTLAGAFFPALTALSKLVTNFLTKNRDGLKKWADNTAAALQKWIDSGGFDRLVENLSAVATWIGKVVDYLGPMGTALAGVGLLALPLVAQLGSLGVAMGSLAIEVFPAFFAAGAALWPMLAGLGTAVAGFAGTLWALAAPMLPVLLLLGSMIFLVKTVRDHWDELTWIVKDWGNTLKWAVLDAWSAVKPIFEKLAGVFGPMSPFGLALSAGNLGAEKLQAVDVNGSAAAAAAAGSTDARVSVDFANLPKGARVSTDPLSSQPVDLSLGYSMVTP